MYKKKDSSTNLVLRAFKIWSIAALFMLIGMLGVVWGCYHPDNIILIIKLLFVVWGISLFFLIWGGCNILRSFFNKRKRSQQ